jgi:DNA-binding beta-propeller fold protein YncE
MNRKPILKVQFLFVFLSAAGLLSASLSSNAQSNQEMIEQWGEFGDEPGQLKYPAMVTLDDSGNVYLVDQHNHRIQKFSSRGHFILMWGKYGSDPGEFNYPFGIAIDSGGDVYVSKWGSEEEIGFRLYMPHEIAISQDGNVILSDRQNHRISFFSKEGILMKRLGEYGEGNEAGGGQFSEPHGLAVSKDGDIYVCDRYNFRIQKFNPSGEYQSAWKTSGVFDDSKHFPIGIAISKNGTVYITDHYAHCIQVYKVLLKP